MKKIITVLMLSLILASNSFAASWTMLQDNKHAKLLLDKQSIAESGKHQKAWVKIQYKKKQVNLEYPDKNYNNAKLLWYFNCKEQKSASVQVYQLLDDEQVFSAAIDVKRARFIEPVPETEIDLAMRYVCKRKTIKEAAMVKKEAAKNNVVENVKQKDGKKIADTKESPKVPEKTEAEKKEVNKVIEVKKKSDKENNIDGKGKKIKKEKGAKKAKKKLVKKPRKKLSKEKKPKRPKKVHWTYGGDTGPEFWGELDKKFASCKTGRNQTPIDINKTVTAELKPLKTFQRFPVKEIFNNGYTIQANFKAGNVLALDGVMYQMKHVHFHAPSENSIEGKSFPLEAHFVHVDPKGAIAILAVMFEEGAENKGLKKLWKQMPKKKGRPKKLKAKVLASELMPRKKGYYRFSGSLNTPPCTEGVIWVVRKSKMTASKLQIDAFKAIIKHDNNRPVQALNGRQILAQ